MPIEEFVRKTASDGDPSADGTSDGAIEGDDGAGGDPESDEAEQVQIPVSLLSRTVQVMRANIAMQEAMRHHRGPTWARVGVVALAIVGVGAAIYGGSSELASYMHPKLPQSSSKQSQGPNLPRDVGDLPVTQAAIYQLPKGENVDLDHVAIDEGDVYFGVLQEPANSWPRISVYHHSFAMGSSLRVEDGNAYSFELVPPTARTGSTDDASWSIAQWSISAMRQWLVTVVTWTDQGPGQDQIVQIYAMNRSNGKYSIVDTIAPEKGVSNRAVVAVGDGEIAVQRGLSTVAGEAPLGLPIQLYSLSGTDPLRALTYEKSIPASFGLMQSPIVISNGLMFQGIAGKDTTSDNNTAVWYSLSQDGSLNRYYGPPVDGQAHWAVEGVSGSLWWVETTPDSSDNEEMQLLMAPLATTKASVAADNLNTPIDAFGVSGSYLAWVERVGGGSDLVIARVQ